ncbi:hypothetical protein HK096_010733, partial [Nowakowskiella sp. JEL0078]
MPTNLTIPAIFDQYPLSATLFTPANVSAKAKILINMATGSRQTFYYKFAEFLCQKQFVVLTYDYRGSGKSIQPGTKSLAELEASTKVHYATRDQPAMIDYLVTNFPEIPLIIIGHSVGGHIVPLCPEPYKNFIDRVFFVSVINAHWRYNKDPFNAFYFAYFFVPYSNWYYGYIPCSQIKLCDDLPAGVGLNWADWIKSRVYYTYEKEIAKKISDFDKPIVSLFFADDDIGFGEGSTSLIKLFSNSKRIKYYAKSDRKVGHNGFFVKSNADLWELFLPFFENGSNEINSDSKAIADFSFVVTQY